MSVLNMSVRLPFLLSFAAIVFTAMAQTNGGGGLPAGLRFKVTFTQPIDTSAAALGDRIQGMLRTAIPGPGKHSAWAPKGSAVIGRIAAIEHVPGPKAAVRLAVRLESAEVGGGFVPLKAEANPAGNSKEVYPPGPQARSIFGTNLFLPVDGALASAG